jgi:hypothetical protein
MMSYYRKFKTMFRISSIGKAACAGDATMWQQMRRLTVRRARALASAHWHASIGTSARTSGVVTGMTGCTCGSVGSSSYCPGTQTISILDHLEQRPASQAGRGGKHMSGHELRRLINAFDSNIRIK